MVFWSKDYNLLLILNLKLSHIWLMGSPSSWLLCPLDMLSSFFKCFLTLGTQLSPNSSCICLPYSLNQLFLHLFSGNWYLEAKIWVLSALIAVRVSLFQVYCNLGLKLEIYTHTLSHTTQTHVHIYIYINPILITMSSRQYLQFQSITMRAHSSFFSFYICISLPQQ